MSASKPVTQSVPDTPAVSQHRPLTLLHTAGLPVLAFLVYLLWGWRNWDILHNIPNYGDVLEVIWGMRWYASALGVAPADGMNYAAGVWPTAGQSPFYYPLLFHPQGWYTASLAHSPYFFLAIQPLYLLGGSAFAYNVVALLGLALAYSGVYVAGRRFLDPLPATAAAVAFAFGMPFFYRLSSHMNILLSVALLPWLLWAVVRAQQEGVTGRRLLGIGLLWSAAISFSFYALFLGGLLLLVCWLIPAANRPTLPQRLRLLLPLAVIAALLNLPLFILFWQARTAGEIISPDVAHLNLWGASLNNLMVPPLDSPWTAELGQVIYRGRIFESTLMNLGVVGGLLALYGLRHLRGRPVLRPLALLLVMGLVLGLGVYLKWDDRTGHLALLGPLNSAIWQLGHWLKPAVFTSATPPADLADAIPLPNLLLVALVPFWEGVRTTARFAFLAVLAAPLLAAHALQHMRWQPLRYGLLALWLLEIVPVPTSSGVSLPAETHPAYVWLTENRPGSGRAIIELHPGWVFHDGGTLLASSFHGMPTVAGVGSQWPAATAFLDNWYRENGALHPDFASMLQAYDVQYVFYYTLPGSEPIVVEMDAGPDFSLVECFAPAPAPTPWPWPICVLEVQPEPATLRNAFLRQGWFPAEPWGVWAEGETSRLQWIATDARDYALDLEAFPHCVPGRAQRVIIYAAGEVASQHQWDEACRPWTATLTIPAHLVQPGWNEIELEYGYAARPVEVSGGQNTDPRNLAVGFSRLIIVPRPEDFSNP